MKKLILACGLSLICTSLFAQSNKVTVVVKKIEGFSESGDAFSFKTTTSKRYQVYNAGGSNPIQGEELISNSIKTKKAIYLRLDVDKTEPRLVQSVHKGKCK